MSEILERAYYEDIVSYELHFDYDECGGFCFSCDRNGKLLEGLNQCAIDNYNDCMAHPERFVVFNEVKKNIRRIRHDAIIKCHCGEVFELWNQFQGACECEKCHQWYNLFGQSLLPPEYWEE